MEHAYVNTLTRGDLSSLRWIESELRYAASAPQDADTDLCRVYYAPLNFRDIMIATGKLPPDSLPGKLAGQVSTRDLSTCLNWFFIIIIISAYIMYVPLLSTVVLSVPWAIVPRGPGVD